MNQEAVVLKAIDEQRLKKNRLIVAIDGRAASGKTTLAKSIADKRDASVIQMDHFFPQAHQRTKERLDKPGGNLDVERFLVEVAPFMKEHLAFSYRPFDCQKMAMRELIHVEKSDLIIVEGAYACHPVLWDLYDFRIFLSIDPEEQRRRIMARNKEAAGPFFEKWIPKEEQYIKEYALLLRCDLVIE